MTASSTYSIPARAKKSISLVNAARMTFGAPATMGQLVESCVPATNVGMCVMHGKKMKSSFRFTCFLKIRLWMWACETLDG